MAYSTQRALSDGTLREILLTIGFIDREDINVFIDDLPITETGATTPTDITYEWVTNNLIRFSEDIPAGSEILIQRSTNLGTVLNVFSSGASFDDPTMDENFLQLLYIAQEAREGSSLAEVFQDIDMHGYRLNNLGVATEPGQAVPLQQMQSESTWAYQSRVAAEAAAATAVSARNAAQLSESNAAGSESAAAASASAANTSAVNAAASAATAVTNRNEAQNFRNEAEGFRDEAEGFRDDAENSALEAAGYAAGVNLPSALGHGGEYLRQRVDEGGFEYRTSAQTRGDLGLGTAATRNAQVSSTDETANSLMAVGAFGLGAGVPVAVAALQSAPLTVGTGFYTCTADVVGSPGGLGAGVWGVLSHRRTGNFAAQMFEQVASNRVFFRRYNSGAWAPWVEFYHDGNISTASVAHAANALGVGQTWQNVAGSRSLDVTYTNTTERTIAVAGWANNTGGASIGIYVGSVRLLAVKAAAGAPQMPFFFVVPAGATYRVSREEGTIGSYAWTELR